MSMPLKNAAASAAARDAAYNVGRRMRRVFEKTVETWEHQVEFDLNITGRIGRDVVGLMIKTDDEIWNWLDKGTSVRFAQGSPNPEDGYVPKTKPGWFGSQASDSYMVFTMYPQPGIEARRWSSDQRMLWLARQLLRDELKEKLRGIMNV